MANAVVLAARRRREYLQTFFPLLSMRSPASVGRVPRSLDLPSAENTVPRGGRRKKGPGQLPAWAFSGVVVGKLLACHARHGLRSVTSRRSLDVLATLGLRCAQQSNWLLATNRHGQVFSLARKRQAGLF